MPQQMTVCLYWSFPRAGRQWPSMVPWSRPMERCSLYQRRRPTFPRTLSRT